MELVAQLEVVVVVAQIVVILVGSSFSCSKSCGSDSSSILQKWSQFPLRLEVNKSPIFIYILLLKGLLKTKYEWELVRLPKLYWK